MLIIPSANKTRTIFWLRFMGLASCGRGSEPSSAKFFAGRHTNSSLYLAPRARSVGDIVAALNLAQPSVSKHLRVLSDVGLVEARRDGRQVFYQTNVDGIRPLHEWTSRFERYWRHQLRRVKARAEHS